MNYSIIDMVRIINGLFKTQMFKILGLFYSCIDYRSCILQTFMYFWFAMLFILVLFWPSSFTDEFFVDETRVWRKYKIPILVSMMSLSTLMYGSWELLLKDTNTL